MGFKRKLQRIRTLEIHVNELLLEMERIETLATKVTSSLKSDVVQSSGSGDKIENAVIRLVELKDEINEKIEEYVQRKRTMYEDIQVLERPEDVEVIYKRYFDGLSWQQIAEAMGYSERQVLNIHGSALARLQHLNQKGEADE